MQSVQKLREGTLQSNKQNNDAKRSTLYSPPYRNLFVRSHASRAMQYKLRISACRHGAAKFVNSVTHRLVFFSHFFIGWIEESEKKCYAYFVALVHTIGELR